MTFITTRTPFRISFFGGGTDYPSWYREHGGSVLSTGIDKYCYITCRYLPPFFNNKHRIVWSHIENVSSISEILHPAIRGGLRMLDFDDSKGIEIHHFGDIPARSGMGSSSSFANGLILALKALRGESVSQQELFRLSIDLEQNHLKENVGSQDQVATAVGGLNVITFGPGDCIEVSPVNIDPGRQERLQNNLMLYFTGTNRLASDIAGKVIAAIPDRTAELRQMQQMVSTARSLLEGNGDIDEFGRFLHEAWQIKRRFCGDISNPLIDDIYAKARSAGAIGGKLLGAGSAGFMVFYVPPERQADVLRKLDFLLHVPFCFDFDGAHLVSSPPSLV